MTILGERPITRRRFSGVSTADHRRELTGATDTTSLASVQPLSGDELENLPEGDRRRRMRKFYSSDDWRVADVSAGLPGDHAIIDTEEYEVFAVEPLTNLIPHNKVIVRGIQEGQ